MLLLANNLAANYEKLPNPIIPFYIAKKWGFFVKQPEVLDLNVYF